MPPIVKTVAADGTGLEDLGAAIEKHRAYLSEGNRLTERRRDRLKSELLERTRDIVMRRITTGLQENGRLDGVLDDLVTGKTDPAAAAHMLAGTT